MEKLTIQNLIYNRLGNSFSVIISNEEISVQLIDNIISETDRFYVELVSLSTEENLKLNVAVNNKFFNIQFNSDLSLTVYPYEYKFIYERSFYYFTITDSNTKFKAGFTNFKFITFSDEKIAVPTEPFLKGIGEAVLFLSQT
ncbi:hypothetical protein [Persephonella sp.]